MAEPLKNQFGADVPATLAAMIAAVFPQFPVGDFVREALDEYEELDLMPRGKKIAAALYHFLPPRFPEAAAILVNSMGPKLAQVDSFGMAPFRYLPYGIFIAEHGLDHFEIAMHAQYELTQRFTAEFSLRPFLEKYPDATLALLAAWATDPSPHVRRLVSEATRPRLPWAPRLRAFQQDPRPILALLELLKDDPELYVRRSVANNLNDIGKDHPHLLAGTCQRWLQNASENRRWLVRHALRSAVKRGETAALDVMGYGKSADVLINNIHITPQRVLIGGAVTIEFQITNATHTPQNLLVDLRVHFIKANGKPSAKVFKLKVLSLEPQGSASFCKKIALTDMTTRKHYPGNHEIDVQLNGHTQRLGAFELV